MNPELVAALDALPAAVEAACSERLRKLEDALKWATEQWPFVELRPLAVCFRPEKHGAIYEPFGDGGKTRVDALIALHERAGKP